MKTKSEKDDFNLSARINWVVHCKKQPYDVYIGRPSPFGNPFSHKLGTQAEVKVDTLEEAIACFEEWVSQQPELIAKINQELKGKILGCWCAPKQCHGDVLAKIANEDENNVEK